MTKRWPCIVVTLLCYLLAVAASATAEGAWVLWEDTISGTKGTSKTSTEPVRAYTTKPDCDHALSDALAEFTNAPGIIVTKDAKQQAAYVTIGNSTIAYRYVCLPDTVDPRGPRGK